MKQKGTRVVIDGNKLKMTNFTNSGEIFQDSLCVTVQLVDPARCVGFRLFDERVRCKG